MTRVVQTEDAPSAVGPYSQATIAAGLVFTAGQIALTPAGEDLTDHSPSAQTDQCLANLRAVLEAADTSLDNVVKTTVFLTDIDDYPDVNEAYGEFFAGDPPARSAVAVDALPKGANVEIEAIASTD